MYQQSSERFFPSLSLCSEDDGLLSGNISGPAGKCMAICKGDLFHQCQNKGAATMKLECVELPHFPKITSKKMIIFFYIFTSILECNNKCLTNSL